VICIPLKLTLGVDEISSRISSDMRITNSKRVGIFYFQF
jgi:hypothetical protein